MQHNDLLQLMPGTDRRFLQWKGFFTKYCLYFRKFSSSDLSHIPSHWYQMWLIRFKITRIWRCLWNNMDCKTIVFFSLAGGEWTGGVVWVEARARDARQKSHHTGSRTLRTCRTHSPTTQVSFSYLCGFQRRKNRTRNPFALIRVQVKCCYPTRIRSDLFQLSSFSYVNSSDFRNFTRNFQILVGFWSINEFNLRRQPRFIAIIF